MKNSSVYEATLHLADIEHFFVKPDLSPFSQYYQDYNYTSGIEYMADNLRTRSSPKEIWVSLLLSSHKIEPEMEQRTKTAIQRYCSSRIVDIEQQMQGLRRRALQTLPIAVLILIVFIGLGTQLTNSRFFVVQIIGDGLGIIGWIYAWFPLDAIIFGIQQYRQDRNIYKKLMNMRLTIKCFE